MLAVRGFHCLPRRKGKCRAHYFKQPLPRLCCKLQEDGCLLCEVLWWVAKVIGTAEDWEAPPVIICGFYAPWLVPSFGCQLLWSSLDLQKSADVCGATRTEEPRGMANGRVYYVMVPEALLCMKSRREVRVL